MRLTVEEHPETIKRYGHLEPARGWKSERCSVRCGGTGRTCTRAKGHRGPHAAHGWFGKLLAVWRTGSGPPQAASEAGRRAPEAEGSGHRKGRPVGLRSRTPAGILEALRDLVARALSSVEEIVLFVLFLAFAGFAVHWLLLIFG